MAKHHEAAELQRDRFASHLQEIRDSGIEINPENEMQRDDQLGEMGAGTHVERESISKRRSSRRKKS